MSEKSNCNAPAQCNNEGDSHAGRTQNQIILKSGYSLEKTETEGSEVLKLNAPDGRVCLDIQLTPEGPVVVLKSVSLEIETQGNLTMNCQKMEMNAKSEIVLNSGGNLSHKADGDVSIYAEGSIQTEGFSQHLRARRGDLKATANDDVMLDGERIRLNSPKPPVCS